jgi:hypothetical protein
MHMPLQRRIRLLLLCMVILLLSVGSVAFGPAKSAHADPDCVSGGVYVLFARGSGEHIYGQRAQVFHDKILGRLSSMGIRTAWAELGNLRGTVLPGRDPTDSAAYPAVFVDKWIASPGYGGSVRIGTQELIRHLNQRYGNGPGDRNCSNETVVLGGYSQGADAIGWTLQGGGLPEELSPAAKSHIGYVALYGDPRFNRGNDWDNCAANNNPPSWLQIPLDCYSLLAAIMGTVSGVNYFASEGILSPRKPYIPQEFAGRVSSWCDPGDGYCTGNPAYLPDGGNHGSVYDQAGGWIEKSAGVIAHAVVPQLNSLIPYSQAYPIPPLPESNFANWQTAPTLTPPPPPIIQSVKRTVDPSGVRQVYTATHSTITEGWWIPGGDSVHLHEMVYISQNNIVGFDKVNLPGGTQAIYTAVPDGVWETWWNPTDGVHSAKIVTGLSGVRQVIADNKWENGQFTHRLYVLAQDGPYEAWWRDGGDGVHLHLLDSISRPVTMTKSMAPDGVTDQLYVATPTWVYELWWNSGGFHHRTVTNISQGDIRSLDKGANLPDGGQLLYIGTKTTGWQVYWNEAGAVGFTVGTIATGQSDGIQIKKTVTGDTHQLYLATPNHVQEFWWSGTGSGNTTLITISQGDIMAFDKTSDGAAQQLYTAAGNNIVWETWWGGGIAPSSNVLFKVAH